MSRTCLLTIASRNYLHYVRTLFESAARHAPDCDRVLALCDTGAASDLAGEPFEVLEYRSLGLARPAEMAFQYSILELNTAIKPWAVTRLLERGYDRVVYLDPDILVTGSFAPVLAALERDPILLTPHLLGPLEDGFLPGEQEILRAGVHNLGFLAVRDGESTRAMLAWWRRKLETGCVVDLPAGLFVDQRWMDLAPGLFAGVRVVRDPGWNVAYWNLPQRRVVRAENGTLTAAGCPLVFFHFSGLRLEGETFSVHQDRYTLETLPAAVRELVETYRARLLAHGAEAAGKVPYGFDRLGDGTRLPATARRLFREAWVTGGGPPLEGDLFEPARAPAVIDWLCSPPCVDGYQPVYSSRLALALHRDRVDLQRAFPYPLGRDDRDFAHWFTVSAEREAGYDPKLVDPVRRRLAAGLPPVEPAPPPPWGRLRARTVRLLRRSADLLDPGPAAAGPGAAPHPSGDRDGVNVIGYLRSESGVGESARAFVRALRARHLATSILEVPGGSRSRQGVPLPVAVPTGLQNATSVFHVNADQMPLVRRVLHPSAFEGRRSIGYWHWELPEFPARWQSSFDGLVEVWTPSEFCRASIAGKAPIPVRCMPHSFDPALLEPSPEATRTPPGPPYLLHVSDVLSVPERKNALGVLEAYRRAFAGRPARPRLVLKLTNLAAHAAYAERVLAAAGEFPDVEVIERTLDRGEVLRLMAGAAAVVSLHRSEGFGLCLLEAMALGRPTVATGWSGNLEFQDPSTAFLVGSRPVELEQDHGPYARGQVWAEPNLDHAAELLRTVVDDPDRAAAVADAGRAQVLARFSPAAIGARIQEALDPGRTAHPGPSTRVGGR